MVVLFCGATQLNMMTISHLDTLCGIEKSLVLLFTQKQQTPQNSTLQLTHVQMFRYLVIVRYMLFFCQIFRFCIRLVI